MKNLILLQFRKSLLPFLVMAGAVLLSVPAALLLHPRTMTGAEAVNVAMIFWALAGLPLAIMALAGAAGADAASDAARAAEQPLPQSQYRQVLAALAAAAAESALLLLAVYAVMGFTVPLDKLTFVTAHVAKHYAFYSVFLVLYCFTLSYAFRNAVAGGLAAAVLLCVTAVPLLSAALFRELMLDLIPLTFLNALTASLALGGALGALNLLCRVYARRESGGAAKVFLAALLLAAPALPPAAGLAALRAKAAEVTWPVYPLGVNPDAQRNEAGIMLVQKPFTGEAFLIDEAGRRAVVFPEAAGGGLAKYLFPAPAFVRGQVLAGPDGAWVYCDGYDKPGVLMYGSPAAGLKLRAALPYSWRAEFVRGKVPGVLDRRRDGFYYARLTTGKEPLKWENVRELAGNAATKRWISGTGAEALLEAFLRGKRSEAPGMAVLSDDGRTVTSAGGRWTVPGAIGQKSPLTGAQRADGINFIVPAREGGGRATYLCAPGKKARKLWPDYFRLGMNLSAAPDGTLWGYANRKSRVTLTVATVTGVSKKEFDSPRFNILTRDDRSIESFALDNILRDLPDSEGDIALVREEKGELWFTIGNAYLVRTGATPNRPYSSWKLPESVRQKYWHSTVQATRNGVMVSAMDGVYFVDWEGRTKKL